MKYTCKGLKVRISSQRGRWGSENSWSLATLQCSKCGIE